MKRRLKISSAKLLLMALLLQVITMSCKKAEKGGAEQQNFSDEVRIVSVEEVNGNAVITWIDPYVNNASKITVKDLQSNTEQSIALGTQKAQFTISNNALLSYSYEIKVVGTNGLTSKGVVARLFKNWAQNIYDRIDYNSSATPQSGMFFKNKPVQTVKVYDIRNDESLAKIASAAMQGVINQEYAYTYLVTRQLHIDQLDDINASYQIQTPVSASKNRGFATLFNQYKNDFKYLVVYDENQKWSWSLALMISAHDKGIPVTPALRDFVVNELGLGNLQIMDIRTKWTTQAAAYAWALDNYANSSNKKIISSVGLRSDYISGPWTMYDYTTASKSFCFWLDETNAGDKQIMDNIFSRMKYPVGTSVMGFGYNTIGDDLNKITNNNNGGFVVSDYYANGSYWSSFPNKSFQQRKGVASEVKPGKIYVAISLSDGDNIQFGQNSLYRIFKEAKHRGEVPLGVTMPAVLQELNPKLLEFYYKNVTKNEELTAGPSGFQFIYGDYYQRSGKYAEWINMNKQWLATAGFHTSHLWIATGDTFKQYMDGSGVDLVLDGEMGRTAGAPMSHKLSNGVVRVDQGTHCWTEGDVYKDLMSVSPSPRRPIFRHIYLLTEFYGFQNHNVVLYERLLRELKKAEQDSPNTFEFLLPMDLAASLKKYIEGGGIY